MPKRNGEEENLNKLTEVSCQCNETHAIVLWNTETLLLSGNKANVMQKLQEKNRTN
jgi:hypothetical protein